MVFRLSYTPKGSTFKIEAYISVMSSSAGVRGATCFFCSTRESGFMTLSASEFILFLFIICCLRKSRGELLGLVVITSDKPGDCRLVIEVGYLRAKSHFPFQKTGNGNEVQRVRA